MANIYINFIYFNNSFNNYYLRSIRKFNENEIGNYNVNYIALITYSVYRNKAFGFKIKKKEFTYFYLSKLLSFDHFIKVFFIIIIYIFLKINLFK